MFADDIARLSTGELIEEAKNTADTLNELIRELESRGVKTTVISRPSMGMESILDRVKLTMVFGDLR